MDSDPFSFLHARRPNSERICAQIERSSGILARIESSSVTLCWRSGDKSPEGLDGRDARRARQRGSRPDPAAPGQSKAASSKGATTFEPELPWSPAMRYDAGNHDASSIDKRSRQMRRGK